MRAKKIKDKETTKKSVKRQNRHLEPSPENSIVTASCIATVTLEYAEERKYDYQTRLKTLSTIIEELKSRNSDITPVLVVLPGGWFDAGRKKPDDEFNYIENFVTDLLKGTQITVCLGIDGAMDKDGYSVDQLGLAINSSGILAVGRKFHPSPQEQTHVEQRDDYIGGEAEYSRIFPFNGKNCYIAVCYDSYGIRQKDLSNPGVDCVVNLVHCFFPKGQGPSGESYFAKHGFAGTSRQWGCPLFGTAIFYDRGMPERWPTGVIWNCGDMSTTKWRYDYNPIAFSDQFNVESGDGNAIVRIFNGETAGLSRANQ